MNRHLLGVVLCGGRSSRMGQDKSNLPHPEGGTFLGYAIDRLATLCGRVCIAGPPPERIEVETLPDPVAYRGPVTGVVSALQRAVSDGHEACLVTPVDMPWLTGKDLVLLCNDWESHRQICCAVDTNHRLQPLVAIVPSTFCRDLEALAESDDRSLSRWMESQHPRCIRLSETACRNVNDPSDLPGG